MDERKPPIPPSEFRLRSASGWTAADIDPPPAALARSDERVAVYFRNGEEVSEGFLVALTVMGIAAVEQLPEPAKPSGREAKP